MALTGHPRSLAFGFSPRTQIAPAVYSTAGRQAFKKWVAAVVAKLGFSGIYTQLWLGFDGVRAYGCGGQVCVRLWAGRVQRAALCIPCP